MIIVMSLIGFVICNMAEDIMWEIDREKALGMDFKYISGKGEQE